MTTVLVALFLVAHGALHLAIWLVRPDPDNPPPFRPDHSTLLIETGLPRRVVHRTSVVLASTSAALYALGGLLVALSAPGAVEVLAVAAIAGVSLKLIFFNRWLILGIALDALVLAAVVTGWPVSL